jgi:hypothetical protein
MEIFGILRIHVDRLSGRFQNYLPPEKSWQLKTILSPSHACSRPHARELADRSEHSSRILNSNLMAFASCASQIGAAAAT